jgi:CRISPR-associated protein Cas5t
VEISILEEFEKALFRKEYPSLGRYEDLFRVDRVDVIEVGKRLLRRYPIKNGIYLNKNTADYLELKGINYRMNFKYDGELLQKTGLRYFEKKDVVYVDNGSFRRKEILFDEEKERIIDLIGDESVLES